MSEEAYDAFETWRELYQRVTDRTAPTREQWDAGVPKPYPTGDCVQISTVDDPMVRNGNADREVYRVG